MKYYLVNYIWQPHRGTAIYPHKCALYEFEKEKTPKDCYDYIHEDLNKNGNKGNEWEDFYCSITDMKLIS